MIGRSVFAGDASDRALFPTFWHPSYVYQPGYAWAAGGAAAAFHGDILGGRLMNSLIAWAIALVIALCARRTLGWKAALLGALVFLTYSQSVVHFRWIYPHNAVALGFAITVVCLLKRSAPRPDWTAGAGLALAATCHPLFVHGALAAWLCRVKRPASWLRLAILPALAAMAGIGWTLARQWPRLWVLEDIPNLALFYGQFSRENGAGFQPLQNFFAFATQDVFHLGAFVAAVACFWRRKYAIPVFLVLASGLLLQNRQNLVVFYYQAVVFLPLMALAWAGAARLAEISVRRKKFGCVWSGTVFVIFLALPAIQFAQMLPLSISGGITPRNSFWTTQDFREVETAANWLNGKVEADDLVVCHQNIGWLLKCHTTDLMQATAWSGRPTFTFEKLPSRERFRYAADLAQAKFLVLADIDQRWTLGQPNVHLLLEECLESGWPVAWRGKSYVILANPCFWKQ